MMHRHLVTRHVHPRWLDHSDPARRGYKRADRAHWHLWWQHSHHERSRFDVAPERMWFSLRLVDRFWTAHGGWYHSTRSVAAHRWERGYPLCQDSDPGRPIYHGPKDHAIGRICETCQVMLMSRLLARMRLTNPHRKPVTGL